MNKIIILLAFSCLANKAKSQNIFIYQPRTGEHIKIYNSQKKPFDGKPLHFRQGEKFKIRLINPNPLFYKYEVKFEEQKEESEDKAITDALASLNTVLAARPAGGGGLDVHYDQYKGAINTLIDDIKQAQQIIDASDVPELETPALQGDRSAGLKYAADQILGVAQPGGNLLLLDVKYRFRSPTLADDLTELMNQIVGLDEVLKRSFQLLNSSLVQKVNDMKKSMTDIETELDSEFTVTDKTTKVLLSITAVDPKKGDLKRPVTKADASIEVVSIVPDFKRSTLELVPMGSFLYAKDVKEFYVEDNLIQSRLKNKFTFEPSVVLNINLVNYGYSNEMSTGVGVGYKFSDKGDALGNFYFSTLFSYKNFFRVGLGIGFATYPDALKNGIKEGQPMPADVKNLQDIIDYKEKPTVFLSLSFTGLSLTNKK